MLICDVTAGGIWLDENGKDLQTQGHVYVEKHEQIQGLVFFLG